MNKIIFYLFTLISLNHFAQETTNQDFKRYSIGFSISPDFCYRYLTSQGDLSAGLKRVRDSIELPKLGSTVGILFNYKLNANLSLETGLLYANKGFQTKFKSSDAIAPTSVADPNIPSLSITKHNINYLDIPLKVNYVIPVKKIKLIAGAGVSTTVFLGERTRFITKQTASSPKKSTSQKEIFDHNPICFAGIASFGMVYDVSDQFSVRIEPIFRYTFTSVFKASIHEFLYSGGINFSTHYSF